MNPTGHSLADVIHTAETFLQKYNPSGTLPIQIEEIVELQMNIAVIVVPGIKELLGIDAFISSNFSQITIDEYSYENYIERTRFSIAHELGHFLLHADWYKGHGPQNLDDYLTFHERINQEEYKYLEIQANTFAGHVLVPTPAIHKTLRTKLGSIPSNEDLTVFLPFFQDMLEVFQVSGETLLIRLQNEKIVKASRR
ncbi:MAG TPA: ImmA/IrrE family metallo-endopeptidase [Candidatus Wunengus sp. YC60]|uniref:ImmA/IrrE family metallo-endopeptidase n=1 Tax=Candidatus Wunengus sp. YC60 TaxID=3367697 RepID=UPI00402606FE